MCFGIDLISSFAVWRPSGVVQGLQTPPGTPDGVWRPSGVKSSLQALRGLKVSGGPARPLRTLRHLQTPQIESGGPQGSPRASRHLQAPQIESGGPPGSRRDPKGAGRRPWGQPRNGVSFTPDPGATAKRCFCHFPKSLFGDGGAPVIGGWGGEEPVCRWGLR